MQGLLTISDKDTHIDSCTMFPCVTASTGGIFFDSSGSVWGFVMSILCRSFLSSLYQAKYLLTYYLRTQLQQLQNITQPFFPITLNIKSTILLLLALATLTFAHLNVRHLNDDALEARSDCVAIDGDGCRAYKRDGGCC